jgi:hypothetical protein
MPPVDAARYDFVVGLKKDSAIAEIIEES